ncbi:MAG: hypothetical protein WCY09_09430 [Candidatus Omnitrophota bacterium]
MCDLIDRAALLERFAPDGLYSGDEVDERIDAAPALRCDGCKKRLTHDCHIFIQGEWAPEQYEPPADFCCSEWEPK